MTTITQPDGAKHQVECTIDELDSIQTELEAVRVVAHSKGYISALRYSQLIEHGDFKSMDEALDKALNGWHRKHDRL